MSNVPPPGYPPPPPPGIPPPASGRSGCWRTGRIGCGIAGLVLLLCVVAGVLYVRRNPQMFTDWAMKQVDAHMASDVTEQEKKDLHDAYDAYRTKLRAGTANQEGLQRMQRVFMTGSNNEISRAQVRELTEGFRRAAGLPPLAPSSAEPETTPSADSSGATPRPVSTRSP